MYSSVIFLGVSGKLKLYYYHVRPRVIFENVAVKLKYEWNISVKITNSTDKYQNVNQSGGEKISTPHINKWQKQEIRTYFNKALLNHSIYFIKERIKVIFFID